MRFGLTGQRSASRWLETLGRRAAEERFVMTLDFYAAVGIQPARLGGPGR